MAIPLHKADQYAQELSRGWVLIPEFRLHQMVRDCLAEIRRGAERERIADLWLVCGIAYGRLGKFVEAREAFREARRHGFDEAIIEYNIGCTYIEDRPKDALEHLFRAADLDPAGGRKDVQLLVHLATALNLNGEGSAAREMFRLALVAHDPSNPGELRCLCGAAGRLGDLHLCVELLARFVALKNGLTIGSTSAIDFLLAVDDAALESIDLPPHVNYAVEVLASYRAALDEHSAACAPIDEAAAIGDDETRLDAMRALRAHRGRATKARSGLYGHDEVAAGASGRGEPEEG